jgi:hypothetical protein
VTSATAETVTDWEQANQPAITIEGPLGSAAAIGTTGARVTTGSVQLLDRDLERLRRAPAGTPIDVATSLPVHLSARNRRRCATDVRPAVDHANRTSPSDSTTHP